MIAEVTMPPIIGVAVRLITSAPVWVTADHIIGSRPKRIAQTELYLLSTKGNADANSS